MDCEWLQEIVSERCEEKTSRTYRFIKHDEEFLDICKFIFENYFLNCGTAESIRNNKREKGQLAISIEKYKLENKV